MKFLKVLSLTATLFMTGCNAKASDPSIEVVSPMEFQSKMDNDSNRYILDVRRPEEFAAGHLHGAHLLNWLDTDKSKTIYVYCRSGRRSNDAANYLSDQGYTVVDMDGGIIAWEKDGFPVTVDSDSPEL